MARLRLSVLFEGIRGSIGDITFKRHGKITIATRRATHENTVWSPAVIAHREEFKTSTEYGKYVNATPDLKAEYLEIRRRQKRRTTPINAIAIGDYWNPPTVSRIKADRYTGAPGDVIEISAVDDVGVASVEVVLRDEEGRILERGEAENRAYWRYTAKTTVPDGTKVRIEATAKDRPGGTGKLEIEVEVVAAPANARRSGDRGAARSARAHSGVRPEAVVLRQDRAKPDRMWQALGADRLGMPT